MKYSRCHHQDLKIRGKYGIKTKDNAIRGSECLDAKE